MEADGMDEMEQDLDDFVHFGNAFAERRVSTLERVDPTLSRRPFDSYVDHSAVYSGAG